MDETRPMKTSLPLAVANAETATFDCSFGRGCEGICCKNGRPSVGPDEIARIADHLPKFLPHLRPESRKLVEAKGLPGVREPHVKHLAGKIWEMRMTGRSGIARALYAAASPQRAVVLRVFIKKSQKTPQAEIDIALARAKEI